jgi:uncharacterized protein YbjT (DUF2867 family)
LSQTVVITGAFSYTGKYATRLLLDRGYGVRTLTYHPERASSFGNAVEAFPYRFDRPDQLIETLRGASALVNTYWVRFPRGQATFEAAVQNTRTLIDAAKAAGIRRIVHVSIANPSLDSPLGYYRGKAELERAVIDSGLSYAILRPTVIFGLEDILINNIAWFVRHLPAFGVPGDGRYPIRPIYVEDLALAIADAVERQESAVADAVGPETFRFEELVRLIAATTRRKVRILHLPLPAAYALTRVTGWFLGDIVLTWEEYRGLMSNLLGSESPAIGKTRLSEWLHDNEAHLGRRYASEIARHYAKPPAGAR